MASTSTAAHNLTLRSVSNDRGKTGFRFLGKFRRPLAMFLTAFILGAGLSVTGASLASPTGSAASEAYACSWINLVCRAGEAVQNAVCMNPDPGDLPTPDIWPGSLVGFIGGAGASALGLSSLKDFGLAEESFTRYEWYGMAGTSIGVYPWDKIGSGCALVYSFAAIPSYMLLELIKGVNFFSSLFLGAILQIDLISTLMGNNDVISTLLKGLRQNLFLAFLVPMVLLAGASILWRGLVKKRMRESWQSMVWVAGSVMASSMFLANPTAIAVDLDKITVQISAYAITTVTSASTAATSANLCVPGDSTSADNKLSTTGVEARDFSATRGMRIITCSLWETFVVTPWASAMLGPVAQASPAPDIGIQSFRNDTSLVGGILEATTITLGQVMNGGDLTSTISSTEGEKLRLWKGVGDYIMNHPGTINWKLWSGSAPVQQFSILLLGLIAQVLAGIPILIMALSMLSQQITFLILMILAPVYLTIGIHPGFGRRIALGWVEMVLATFVKRILNAVLIAVMLAYFAIIISTQGTDGAGNQGVFGLQWWGRAVLLIVGAFAVMKARKRLMKEAGSFVDLGGRRMDPSSVAGGSPGLRTLGTEVFAGAGALMAGKKLGEHQGLKSPELRKEMFKNARSSAVRRSIAGVPVVGAASESFRSGFEKETSKIEGDREAQEQTRGRTEQQRVREERDREKEDRREQERIAREREREERAIQREREREQREVERSRRQIEELARLAAAAGAAAATRPGAPTGTATGSTVEGSGVNGQGNNPVIRDANGKPIDPISSKPLDPNTSKPSGGTNNAVRDTRVENNQNENPDVRSDAANWPEDNTETNNSSTRDTRTNWEEEYEEETTTTNSGDTTSPTHNDPNPSSPFGPSIDQTGSRRDRTRGGSATRTAQDRSVENEENGSFDSSVEPSSDATIEDEKPQNRGGRGRASSANNSQSDLVDTSNIEVPNTGRKPRRPSSGDDRSESRSSQPPTRPAQDHRGSYQGTPPADEYDESYEEGDLSDDYLDSDEEITSRPSSRSFDGSYLGDTSSSSSSSEENSDQALDAARSTIKGISKQIKAMEQKKINLIQRESEIQFQIAQFQSAGNPEGAENMRRVLEDLQREKNDIDHVVIPNLQKREAAAREEIDRIKDQTNG